MINQTWKCVWIKLTELLMVAVIQFLELDLKWH